MTRIQALLCLLIYPLSVGASGGDAAWQQLRKKALEMYQSGKYAWAQQLMEHALAEARKFGIEDERYCKTADDLGKIYLRNEKNAQAAGLFQEVLKLREKNLWPEHPDTMEARKYLAEAYHRIRRVEDAERLLLTVLSFKETTFGSDHPYVINYLRQLSGYYIQQGKIDKAFAVLFRARKALETTFESDDPKRYWVYQDIGDLYLGQHKAAEAERYLKKALSIYDCEEAKPWALAQLLTRLADAYIQCGKLEAAAACLGRAVVLTGRSETLQTARLMDNYAVVLRSVKRAAQAEKWERKAAALHAKLNQ